MTAHQLMMQWPSAYMLLPSAYLDWSNGLPSVSFMTPSHMEKTYTTANYQYIDALRQINQMNYVTYNFAGLTESFPNPLDENITQVAIFVLCWRATNFCNSASTNTPLFVVASKYYRHQLCQHRLWRSTNALQLYLFPS